jgi:hypothetical protein
MLDERNTLEDSRRDGSSMYKEMRLLAFGWMPELETMRRKMLAELSEAAKIIFLEARDFIHNFAQHFEQ